MEYNLSEKIIKQPIGTSPISGKAYLYYFRAEDVKEFIREIKKMIKFEVQPLPIPRSISARLDSQIDIIAGDKLI